MNRHGLDVLAKHLSTDHLSRELCLGFLQSFKEGFPEDVNLVYLEGYPTHTFAVTIDPDKLRAYLSILPYTNKDIPRLSTQIEGVCASLGLIMDDAARDRIVTFLKPGVIFQSPPIHELFLQGTPSVSPKPSRVALHVKPLSKEPQYQENDDGSVDYYHLNLFQNVVEQQHIADHIAARKGMNGRDVFGRVITVDEKPAPGVRAGQGVMLDEELGQYFSAFAGYVEFEDFCLSVHDTYTVEGDVNMEVGNVSFVSHVVVKGDVCPDFSVQAGGSIDVFGSVTGATLIADENIHLRRGILGQGKSSVVCRGDFDAKFCNDTNVEVKGDLRLETEALNSSFGTFGECIAPEAIIIGGRLVSIKAMHVHTLGSELGLRTEVFLGQDFETLNRSEKVRLLLAELDDQLEAQFEGLNPHIVHWQVERSRERFTPGTVETLLEKCEDAKELLQEYRSAQQEYALLSQDVPKGRVQKCFVEGCIFPGTVFYGSGHVFQVKEPIFGPVVVEVETCGSGGQDQIVVKSKD
jgi:hypothetical protein